MRGYIYLGWECDTIIVLVPDLHLAFDDEGFSWFYPKDPENFGKDIEGVAWYIGEF